MVKFIKKKKKVKFKLLGYSNLHQIAGKTRNALIFIQSSLLEHNGYGDYTTLYTQKATNKIYNINLLISRPGLGVLLLLIW